MKASRFSTITISLDTHRHRELRPEQRREQVAYLLDRLLCGDSVAESEFRYFKMRVSAREAVSGEIEE